MYLSFNDALCEAAVEGKIQRKISDIDFRLAASFRKQANSIYTNVPPRKREAAFFVLYRRFFSELGHLTHVKSILAEFVSEGNLPSECCFVRTLRDEEEGAQLSEDGSRLGVQIKIETLLDPDRCAYLLRHELTHILDILDPAFSYDTSRPLSEVSPSEESLLRDRYRTLWDLSVDGRIERKGFLPEGLRERRAKEFQTLFPNLGEPAAEQVFIALWGGTRPSNEELRQMVKGTSFLCSTLKISSDISDDEESHPTFGPGSLCPLCRFPTHEWAETTEHFSQQVKLEFPGWKPSQGICSQCANRYQFTAAFSMDSPGSTSRTIDPTSTSLNGSGMEDI
jgi:hypothetical protein